MWPPFGVWFFVLFTISLSVFAFAHKINVTEENELEHYLCSNGNTLQEDTVLVLSTAVTHYISSNVSSFCIINMTYSLTLTTDSSESANVQCKYRKFPTTGFAFANLHKLTLQKLNFTGCGGFLWNASFIDIVNSTDSPVYFTLYQSAMLLFLYIKTLFIGEVNITSYYGYAMLAINPMNASFDALNITHANTAEYALTNEKIIGCGILLLFSNYHNDHIIVTHNISVNHTTIYGNVDVITAFNCSIDFQELKSSRIPIISAAGLTVLYTQTNFNVKVLVENIKFSENFGAITGAMLVLHYKDGMGDTTLVNASFDGSNEVDKKICSKFGSGLSLISMKQHHSNNSLNVFNSVFKPSQMPLLFHYEGARRAVFVGVYNPDSSAEVKVTFRNTTFANNSISSTGSCLYARTYFDGAAIRPFVLTIIMENISAFQNFQTDIFSENANSGMFTIINARVLKVASDSAFYDNYGSVFDVTDTEIRLSGKINFTRNRGERGPTFKLQGSSRFHLDTVLNATFVDNTALTKGGAIYAHDYSSNQCMFQVKDTRLLRLVFINNSASESGSSIYSNNLYNCDESSGKTRSYSQSHQIYETIFVFQSVSQLKNISTSSVQLFFCSPSNHTSKYFILNAPVYPGQSVVLHLVAKNRYFQGITQYAVVYFALGYQLRGDDHSSWHVSPDDINKVLLETQDCTVAHITLLKKDNVANVDNAANLTISSIFAYSGLNAQLELSDCPLGFELDITSGKCVCSKVIKDLGIALSYKPSCQIDSIPNIARPNSSAAWLGLMKLRNGTTVYGTAVSCYIYCNSKRNDHVFVVDDTTVLIADAENLSDAMALCIKNREGPLCSNCAPGYSVVFGSNECKQCSNWWLLTLIAYAVAGPLFIYLLYALRLTLAVGTINGIIFYFQLIMAVDISPSSRNLINKLAKAGLCSSLDFPLCFYHGMTELWKIGFRLIYSVYLLTILFLLIILSRFSVRLSNRISGSSIQVLVTVVHISFSRLLMSILDVFTPIEIYVNDTTVSPLLVWSRNGTIHYGKDGHQVLMVITMLVVGPILGIYMSILLAGRPLMRISYKFREYIRPVYEAIHAPYKHNREFFFAARLLVVIVMYSLYAIYRNGNEAFGFAIALTILLVYIGLEGICRPFKRMSLNIFNFILLLFVVINCVFLNSYSTVENFVMTVMTISNSAIIISVIGVFILHLFWVTGLLVKLKRKSSEALRHLPHLPRSRASDDNFSGSFLENYDRVREPLLSPNS